MPERKRLYLTIVAIFVWASCSGGGCSGCSCSSPIPGGFNYANKLENAMQVRLSSSGVEFIESDIAEIADSVVGSLDFQIGCAAVVAALCCCDGGDCPECVATTTVNSVSLVPTAPNSLKMDQLRVEVHTDEMPLSILSDCTVSIDTSAGSQPDVGVVADLMLTPNATSGRLFTSLENPQIEDFESEDINLDYEWYQFDCAIADLLFPLFLDFFVEALTAPIANSLDAYCLACDDVTGCPDHSSCQSGTCMEETDGTCVQSFGRESRISAMAALGDLASGSQANVDLLAWAGGYAAAINNGISFGMLSGGEPAAHDECVPVTSPPARSDIPLSTTLQGNTIDLGDGNSNDFDVSIGMHEQLLDQAAWGLFDSGGLCLNVTSANPDLGSFLSSASIGLLVDLSHLVTGEPAPMMIALRPQQPPTVDIGQGSVSYDVHGEPTIDEPLMTVNFSDFAMDFYMLVDQRYVRLMRLSADVALPFGLDTDELGNVVVLTGDFDAAFTNLVAQDTELLHETPEEIAKVFPVLFSLVSAYAGGLVPPITLPSLSGFEFVDPVFRGIDANSMIAMFSQLDFTPPAALLQSVNTRLRIVQVHTPPTAEFRASGEGQPLVQVEVSVGPLGGDDPARGAGTAPAPIEWSWRLDGGLWSIWRRQPAACPVASPVGWPVAWIDSPLLRLQGRHRLEVRAREIGQPTTLDPTPASAEVIIDSVAPDLDVRLEDETLVATATDNITPSDMIDLGWSAGAALPQHWSAGEMVIPPSAQAHGQQDFVLYARDEAGNLARRSFHGQIATLPGATAGCTCAVGAEAPANDQPRWPISIVTTLLAALALRARARRRSTERNMPCDQ